MGIEKRLLDLRNRSRKSYVSRLPQGHYVVNAQAFSAKPPVTVWEMLLSFFRLALILCSCGPSKRTRVIDQMGESLYSDELEARWGDGLALTQRTAPRSAEASSFFEREAALCATGRIHDESEKT
jgi:hypothetical protein